MKKHKKEIIDRYSRTDDNKVVIDVTVGKIEYLYNDFDKHTRYSKKELDQDLVDYLIDSMDEIGKENFIIQFRITETIDSKLKSRLRTSIHNYFIYLKELEIREVKRMLRRSFILALIGIAILNLSIWVNMHLVADESVISQIFAEGLTIAAWVSLWEALATFILNWAPHQRRIRMYERIATANVLFLVETKDGQKIEAT